MMNRLSFSIPGLINSSVFSLVFIFTLCIHALPEAAASIDRETQADTAIWTAEDHEKAKKIAHEIPGFVDNVLIEERLLRQQRLRDIGLDVKDITHSYFLLDSPIINRERDDYKPVKFMHSKHAAVVKDCSACHHYRPEDPKADETTRCSACHQESFDPDHPERPGLKAAYHLQCMGCHDTMDKGPTDCTGCHRKNTPDHRKLVKLPEHPKPSEVTEECLRCHTDAGTDMLASVHWLWQGPSPNTLGHADDVHHGKGTTVLNNF